MKHRNLTTAATQRAFTLVELVVVIIILGILGGLSAGILLQPFRAFEDQARRAELVAEADLALTRMVRELRMALPNSVRIAGGGSYLEFIPTTDGGRYRALPDPADPASDPLDFAAADSSFDVLGGLAAGAAPGDQLVIYNATASGPAANAYIGDNRAPIAAFAGGTMSLSTARLFPFPSLGAQRFDVVPASGPVSYFCADGQLRRHTGYGFSPAQPAGFGSSDGALLADRVSLCQFTYQPGDHVRNGLVTLRLGLTAEGESINLLYQAQVVNAP
ncbi:prepilin-type N-terminal cleavage/methylation domain-containing protein [Pseudothauera lacus]|uniref:Type II secretion system protein n=1 Tax=Pseudothauera lacus TaxID=2136175 RepID=A0A2T4IGE2_9RHOO|nr:prepilin-type N-terminal cleavage/methylation domain-containing protein [Pseudothauera lacus]PTD96817.1 type II secretion system protein [Pseudothauera lacus]